jgi:hypothetical protein
VIVIAEVAEILNRFPEVQWDRCTHYHWAHYKVFGWLAREDGRSDFVLLEWTAGETNEPAQTNLTTSSAEYSQEFGRRLHGEHPGRVHLPCERVEDVFGALVPNAIHLEKS